MFITNTTESGSFVSNNMLAVMCDVLVLGLWIVAVWAKFKSTIPSYKRFALSCIILIAFLFFAKESRVMGLPPYNLPLQYYNAYDINQKIHHAVSQPKADITCKQANGKERES